MAKKKGKSREQKQKEMEEKYNEQIVIDSSFEDLIKMSLGIKTKPNKDKKGSE